MSNPSVHATPGAVVAESAGSESAYQAVRLWSTKGRIGRLRYSACLFGSYVICMVLAIGTSFLTAAAGNGEGGGFVIWAIAVPYGVFTMLKTIQRSHDMDWPGWSSLGVLVPIVGLIWAFKAGTPGANRFGPPSPPASPGVKLMGLGVPAILLVLVVVLALWGALR